MKKIGKYMVLGMLFFVLAAVFLGCDEGMNMVKPVVSEPAEPPPQQEETPGTTMGGMKAEKPEASTVTESEMGESELIVEMDPVLQEPTDTPQLVRPGEVALSEEEAREKAYAIARELYPIYVVARRTSMYERFDAEVLEKTGFNALHLERTLGAITREEDPTAEKFYSQGTDSPMHFLAEYFRLTFQHPEKTEDEILEFFRQAAQNGLIAVYRLDVELKLDIIEQLWLDAGEISYRIWDEVEEIEDDLSIETAEEFYELLDNVCIKKSGLSFFSHDVLSLLEGEYFTIFPDNEDEIREHHSWFYIKRRITWEFLYTAFKNPEIQEKWEMLNKFEDHLKSTEPIFSTDENGIWKKSWHSELFIR